MPDTFAPGPALRSRSRTSCSRADHQVLVGRHPEIPVKDVAQGPFGNAGGTTQVRDANLGFLPARDESERAVQDVRRMPDLPADLAACAGHGHDGAKHRIEEFEPCFALPRVATQGFLAGRVQFEHAVSEANQRRRREIRLLDAIAGQQGGVAFVLVTGEPRRDHVDGQHDAKPARGAVRGAVKRAVGRHPGDLVPLQAMAVDGERFPVVQREEGIEVAGRRDAAADVRGALPSGHDADAVQVGPQQPPVSLLPGAQHVAHPRAPQGSLKRLVLRAVDGLHGPREEVRPCAKDVTPLSGKLPNLRCRLSCRCQSAALERAQRAR